MKLDNYCSRIEHQEVDICDVKIVGAKIANNCILHNYQADRFNYTPRGEIQLPKVNRRGHLGSCHLILSDSPGWNHGNLLAGRQEGGGEGGLGNDLDGGGLCGSGGGEGCGGCVVCLGGVGWWGVLVF